MNNGILDVLKRYLENTIYESVLFFKYVIVRIDE